MAFHVAPAGVVPLEETPYGTRMHTAATFNLYTNQFISEANAQARHAEMRALVDPHHVAHGIAAATEAARGMQELLARSQVRAAKWGRG
jgi:hypothetical protein